MSQNQSPIEEATEEILKLKLELKRAEDEVKNWQEAAENESKAKIYALHRLNKLTEQYYSSPTYVVLREERDNLLAEVQRLEDYNAEISADRTRFLDESAFYHNQVIHLQKDIEKLKQDPLATTMDATKDEKWINSDITTGKVINYLQTLEPTVARQLLKAAWSILDLQEAEREAMAVTMEATEGRR